MAKQNSSGGNKSNSNKGNSKSKSINLGKSTNAGNIRGSRTGNRPPKKGNN